MFKSYLRVGLAAAALVGSMSAGTAQADSTGLFNLSVGNCGYNSRQLCAGYGQGVPVGLSQLAVEINCSASSPFVVDRTGVGCFIRGLSDGLTYLHTGPLFIAGNEAEASNVGFVPFQGYELCVGAGYSTATGEFRAVQNYRCM